MQNARPLPFHRVFPGLLRDAMGTIEWIGRESAGEIVRIGLGPVRAYLVTRPEHVERVLDGNAANYRREGLMWRPLSRLVGEPSGADPEWPIKRDTFASLLSGPNIAAVTDAMADRIGRAVDELGERAYGGRRLDSTVEMNRVVYRAITEIFVGGKLSLADVDELGAAITTATSSSFRARMLLPFVPHAIPLPGDRAFKDAVRAVDDLIYPIVRAARRTGAPGDPGEDGGDIVSRLMRAHGDDGRELGERGVRDGIVSLFVAGTETTVTALTFLWGVLDSHPEVARRLYGEIDQVVGAGPPRRAHLPKLVYTKMVLEELLRLYSVGWILPRVVTADDVIDGVRIPRGATVLVCPYLTHRLPDVWPDPETFDPERFAPHGERRNRYAYLAFGAGPHRCVGSFFFTVEATLIVATILSRYRPVLDAVRIGNGLPAAQPGLTLKPRRQAEIALTDR